MPIRVYVADDHALMREGVLHFLRSHADVEIAGSAGDGRTAVRDVALLKPDVFIVDIAMPDMNGIEATRQIKALAPKTAVVILSMHVTAEHVFNALDAGASAYVLKGSESRDIINAVRAAHRGRQFLSPALTGSIADAAKLSRRISPLASLSKREREILQLVVEGHSSAAIAKVLHLSPKSVDTYRSRLMQKLEIGDIPGLVKFAIEHGLTPGV